MKHVQQLGAALRALTAGSFAILVLLLTVQVGVANEPNLPVPQLVYITETGLDPQRNSIDRLISLFGSTCNPDLKKYRAGPCGIELDLVAYLKTLPSDFFGISNALTELGARCDGTGSQLNCLYERHVVVSNWKADSPVPVSIADEFYRIELIVSGRAESLTYEAKFSRKTARR